MTTTTVYPVSEYQVLRTYADWEAVVNRSFPEEQPCPVEAIWGDGVVNIALDDQWCCAVVKRGTTVHLRDDVEIEDITLEQGCAAHDDYTRLVIDKDRIVFITK